MRTDHEFNADEETRPAPILRLDGVPHRGRVLSIEEWFAFAERFDAQVEREASTTAAEAKAAVLEAHALMLEFMRAVFPPRRSWRTWFRRIDPVAAVATLGHAAVTEAFHTLFAHQAIAQGLVPRRLSQSPTDGTDSPDKTTPAPNADSNTSATS